MLGSAKTNLPLLTYQLSERYQPLWIYFAVVIEPFFGWVVWEYHLTFNMSDLFCCLLSRPAAWPCVQVIVMVVCHTPKTLVNLHESYQMLRSLSLFTVPSPSASFFIIIAIITLRSNKLCQSFLILLLRSYSIKPLLPEMEFFLAADRTDRTILSQENNPKIMWNMPKVALILATYSADFWLWTELFLMKIGTFFGRWKKIPGVSKKNGRGCSPPRT